MTAYQQVVAAWNAQADEHNQWDALGEDEKIEWALKCADQFRGATKMMQAALTITSDRPPNKQGDEEWKQNTHRGRGT